MGLAASVPRCLSRYSSFFIAITILSNVMAVVLIVSSVVFIGHKEWVWLKIVQKITKLEPKLFRNLCMKYYLIKLFYKIHNIIAIREKKFISFAVKGDRYHIFGASKACFNFGNDFCNSSKTFNYFTTAIIKIIVYYGISAFLFCKPGFFFTFPEFVNKNILSGFSSVLCCINISLYSVIIR